MGVIDEATTARIRSLLRHHPKGMMISDLSHQLKINRNIMAKYLEILRISGQVDMEMQGNAKVYTLSQRAPLSALLESTSDCILLLDGFKKILWVNKPVLALCGKKAREIEGRFVHEIDNPFFAHLPIAELHESNDTITEITFEHDGNSNYYRVKMMPAVLDHGGSGYILFCENITAEVVFQQLVERSEARFRAIVEDQTEYIARYLPDGKITFVNGSCARLWGKKPEELLWTPFFSLFRESDADMLKDRGLSLDPNNPQATVECRVLHSDGSERQLQWTIRALFDKENRLEEYQVVGRDITEQAEAAARIDKYIKFMAFLSKTGRTFMDMGEDDDIYAYITQQIYSLAPGSLVWIGILDHSNMTLSLKGVGGNPVALDTMQQLTGIKVRDMVFPIDNAYTDKLIRHHNLEKAPQLFQLLHMQVPEAICTQIEKIAGGIDSYLMGLVSKGKVLGDVGISIQAGSELANRELIEAFIQQSAIAIEKKIAEDILKESEQLYRGVLDNIQDVYYRSDNDGRLVMASPSWASLLGYDSLDECIGKDIAETFHKEPFRRKEFLDTLYRDGEVRDYELVLKRKDDKPLFVAVSSHVLRDASGRVLGIEGIFRDITQRHLAEEKNKDHLAEMEFISKKAREFLELSAEADIYSAIAKGLSDLIPNSVISISSCDPGSPVFTIRNICGIGAQETFRRITGSEITGFSFTINDPSAYAFIKQSKLYKAYGNLYTGLFGQMPYQLCRQLEEILDLDEIYILGLVSREHLLGCASILLQKGHHIPKPELIEAFIQQSSLVLAWRRADDAVRRSEARFRAIVEDQTEFVIRFLPDGKLTFVNTPFCRAAGMDQQGLAGRSFFSMIPDEDRRILVEGLHSLSVVNPKMEIRHRFIDTRGRRRWFHWTNRAIFNDREHVVEYDGIGRDITDLQEATTRIRNHPDEIRFLSLLSRELAEIRDQRQVLAFTAQKIQAVLPGSLVGICSYTPVSKELVFHHIEGSPETLSVLNREIGQDLTGEVFTFNADSGFVSQIGSRRLVPVSGHIGLFFRSVSPAGCSSVAERLNLGRLFMMGLPSSDGTLDAVLIQLGAGSDLPNPELVEAAISQAGLAVAWGPQQLNHQP